MPGTRRGANSPERVRRQKIHAFSKTKEELEEENKEDLLETAEDLGVLGDVPVNSESGTPLKKDLVSHLAALRHQTIS